MRSNLGKREGVKFQFHFHYFPGKSFNSLRINYFNNLLEVHALLTRLFGWLVFKRHKVRKGYSAPDKLIEKAKEGKKTNKIWIF